jgi:uncharacterized membrane protein
LAFTILPAIKSESFNTLGVISMDNDEPKHSSHTISKTRLEFLVDGIFAIAMTILVLELTVPELNDHNSISELFNALLNHLPTFASYLLSFLILGLLWYRHNSYFQYFHFISQGMLVLQLLQLAAAAFIPFTASLMGRYPTNRLSQIIYLACIMIYLWSSFASLVLAKRAGALNAQLSQQEFLRQRKGLLNGSIILSVLVALYLVTLIVK